MTEYRTRRKLTDEFLRPNSRIICHVADYSTFVDFEPIGIDWVKICARNIATGSHVCQYRADGVYPLLAKVYFQQMNAIRLYDNGKTHIPSATVIPEELHITPRTSISNQSSFLCVDPTTERCIRSPIHRISRRDLANDAVILNEYANQHRQLADNNRDCTHSQVNKQR